MTDSVPSNSAARRNLRWLNIIRGIAIGGQFFALYYFWGVKNIGLPGTILTTILLIYAGVLIISSWRSYWRQPITETEFFGHLLVDIVFFTALLYYSGGASNPFVSYYLVPISIAAATLRWRFSWLMTLLSLAAYTGLMLHNYPIPALSPNQTHHLGDQRINLHIAGMWATFVISAVLITYFVVKMAHGLRQQEALATQQRENQLRDDQVLAVATLAAGTAHQLGTPLNTMQILLDEMQAQPQNQNTGADLETLRQQVQECRKTLQRLVATAELTSDAQAQPQDLRHYFNNLFVNWRVVRPDVEADIQIGCHSPRATAYFPPTVAQSLQNLLNNAADASQKVDVRLKWTAQQAELNIRDYGPGISNAMAEHPGKPVISSKPGGLGLGLFLTHTALNRIGGKVTLTNAPDGGAVTKAIIPLLSTPTIGTTAEAKQT